MCSGSGSILDPECSLLAKRFNRTLGPLVGGHGGHSNSVGDHLNNSSNPYEKWSNGSDAGGIGIGSHNSSNKGIFGNGERMRRVGSPL